MKNALDKRRRRRAVSLVASLALGAGAIALAPTAFAADPVQGTTVTANADSPTGYTVTFTYHNENATQVRLAGDLTLLDVTTGNTRYQPEAWQTGRYHAGGTEFLRDMTKDADGNWTVTLPLHAGGLSYWYRVWDPTQGWVNKRIYDPASTNPRPPGDQSFRDAEQRRARRGLRAVRRRSRTTRSCRRAASTSCRSRTRRRRAASSTSSTRRSWATTATTWASTCRRATTPTARSRTRWRTWRTGSSATRPTS